MSFAKDVLRKMFLQTTTAFTTVMKSAATKSYMLKKLPTGTSMPLE